VLLVRPVSLPTELADRGLHARKSPFSSIQQINR